MRVLLAGVAMLFAFGCTATERVAEPAKSERPAQGFVTASDGVPIAYEIHGNGDATLLFVHCWACDRSFWKEEVGVFSGKYEVVTLDLAGHGASGHDRDDWSIARLAEDVVDVVRGLDLTRVVLIGHSLGGPLSLVAASKLPDRVVGVVGVDTLHSVEFRFPEEAIENLISGFQKDFPGMMRSAVAASFPEGADPAIIRWVTERALEANQKAVLAIARGFPEFNPQDALSSVKVPVRCINARPYSPTSFETRIEVNRRYGDFDAKLMDGVGHYPMLEKPAEFNRMLESTLHGILEENAG